MARGTTPALSDLLIDHLGIMKRFGLLLSFLVCCSGGNKAPPVSQVTGGDPPTIVNSVVLYDCDTQLAPTGECLMSDGSFEHLKIYPANHDGSSPPITCVDGYAVFNLVDCNGGTLCYFCLLENFTCNYFAPTGFDSGELCSVQN
jgi:hypothetical protein